MVDRRSSAVTSISASLLLVILILTGCGSVRTQTGFYEPVYEELETGNFTEAAAGIERAKENGKYGHKDRLVYYLDAGMVYHYAMQYDTSNTRLHLAEDAAEELFTKSISRAATSMLLNDNVLEYSGEDYEILYANLMKCLNYIRKDDIEDAFVEVRRANLKLELLDQKYDDAAKELTTASKNDTLDYDIEYAVDNVRFHNDAFARYLSMHMYASEAKWDDAHIDFELLKDAFAKQSQVYQFDLPKVKYKPSSGKSILSVVGLAGLSPTKEAFELRVRSDKDLELIQVLYTDTEGKDAEYGHLPIDLGVDLYFKFAIPRIAQRPSVVKTARVFANNELIGELQIIEDLYLVAEETFRARKSIIYFKSIGRSLAKALANYKLKKEVDTGGLAGWLKKAAVDVVTDLTEGADLRCCRTLPGRIFVGDFELEPGTYDLRIEFVDYSGHTLDVTYYPQYKILDKGLNLVEAFSLQ